MNLGESLVFAIQSACASSGHYPWQYLSGVHELYDKCKWFVLDLRFKQFWPTWLE